MSGTLFDTGNMLYSFELVTKINHQLWYHW